jgi:hypothetical protein
VITAVAVFLTEVDGVRAVGVAAVIGGAEAACEEDEGCGREGGCARGREGEGVACEEASAPGDVNALSSPSFMANSICISVSLKFSSGSFFRVSFDLFFSIFLSAVFILCSSFSFFILLVKSATVTLFSLFVFPGAGAEALGGGVGHCDCGGMEKIDVGGRKVE